MKNTATLAAVLGTIGLFQTQAAQAQCHFSHYSPAYYGCHHKRDSCAVETPFKPGRLGGYLGLLGLADRQGTPYAGMELEGYYWLAPRWSTGLRGSITGQMPVGASEEWYAGVSQPRLSVVGVLWSNNLLLTDRSRWRLALQAGAGVGIVNLYDKARQVPIKGSCGCTKAEQIASGTSPITELGLAATYKLKGKEAPWLTVRGGYRAWTGAVPFGAINQFSTYVLSVGVTMPDAPTRRK